MSMFIHGSEPFLFYLFASLSIASGIMVIRARNPVHSVLFLILVFCNAAGLLLLLGLDFFAMIFLVVYVGAIAVLFLFVVIILNIVVAELNESLSRYLPIGGWKAFLPLLLANVLALAGLLLSFELFGTGLPSALIILTAVRVINMYGQFIDAGYLTDPVALKVMGAALFVVFTKIQQVYLAHTLDFQNIADLCNALQFYGGVVVDQVYSNLVNLLQQRGACLQRILKVVQGAINVVNVSSSLARDGLFQLVKPTVPILLDGSLPALEGERAGPMVHGFNQHQFALSGRVQHIFSVPIRLNLGEHYFPLCERIMSESSKIGLEVSHREGPPLVLSRSLIAEAGPLTLLETPIPYTPNLYAVVTGSSALNDLSQVVATLFP